jgi:hypothetical protein
VPGCGRPDHPLAGTLKLADEAWEMRDSRFDTVNPDLARYSRMSPRTFSHTNRTEFPWTFSTSCARTCDPV